MLVSCNSFLFGPTSPPVVLGGVLFFSSYWTFYLLIQRYAALLRVREKKWLTRVEAGCIVLGKFVPYNFIGVYFSYCYLYLWAASYHFHVKQTHSKRECLIPLDEVLKSSDFLVDDSCVFGVRILKADVSSQNEPIVIPKKPNTVQNIFLQKKGFIKGTYTWTMNNFLDMKLPVFSPAFDVGGQKWYASIFILV